MPNVLDQVLNGLMSRYAQRVPAVDRILKAMEADGIISSRQDIENDHIAFRTMGVPQLGIRSFERIFMHYGYQKQDSYHFAAKKIDANWYKPPQPHQPRIFVSELRVGDLSEAAQAIIHSYTDELVADPVDHLELDDAAAVDTFLHAGLWRLPSWADFSRLLQESEYAAWVIYNRYYLNHFTLSVHNLPEGLDTVHCFNVYVEKLGVKLNNSGGKVKESPDGLLLQSSTVAEMVSARFADGDEHQIAGSYVEFAERRILPSFASLAKNAVLPQHRREGFETGNADKIFESTYTSQTSGNG